MRYANSVARNLIILLHSLGSLQKEQLVRFFSDTMEERQFNVLLKQLTSYNYIKYDKETDRYYWSREEEYIDEIKGRTIRAFWIAASSGSRKIAEIYPLNYPQQLGFITDENVIYDVTVCYSQTDALAAKEARDRNRIEGVPDGVNHVAVVNDRELGKELGRYGFDVYCMIDPETHIPYYEYCG